MYNVLLLLMSLSFVYAQTYCAGDQVSLSHQNQEHLVGAGIEGEYEAGDSFKLADWNGELNGGQYHVIFIDMSASWWGPCQSNAPIVDGLEEDFNEFGVKFVTSLSDVGQPYSAEQWQSSFGNSDTPLVIDENQSSTGMFSLFHDSWNAFPTFAILDHTMTVRAKPWTLDSNTNTSSCDGTNATIDGWSGGSTTDFLEQLVEECGPLCEECSGTTDTDGDGIADECDDCNNMSGDTNDDMTIDILDIVSVVNIILNGGINSPNYTECEKSDADFDGNGTINILDIIQIINTILGQGRTYSDIDTTADLNLSIDGNDLIISVNSETALSGIQLSFYTDVELNVRVNDTSSDIFSSTKLLDGIQRYVGFSMENTPFEDNLEIIIENGSDLSNEDIDVVLASTTGNEVSEIWNENSEVNAFAISKMFPNPFNPSTEISYTVNQNGTMRIAVYNILGQQVTELYSGHRSAGRYNILWNAENMASGVYYVNITHSNGQVENMKAVLLK